MIWGKSTRGMRIAAIASFAVVTFATANSNDLRYDRETVGMLRAPKEANLYETQFGRMIEPTSPILGYYLSRQIKRDPRSPKEIFADIDEQYQEWDRDMDFSIVTYFETLQPSLDRYCAQGEEISTVAPKGGWTQVEPAAIPLEALLPHHKTYRNKISQLTKLAHWKGITDEELRERANAASSRFQEVRNNCPPAKKLEKLETKAKKVLGPRWDQLVELNHDLSSAEAAFPRLQFSINGYTQYVYRTLLTHPNLKALLDSLYEAETSWLDEAQSGVVAERFITYVERQLLNQGFEARDILLVLAYSTRNMPSLDTQYSLDRRRALMLEVYFWKFKAIRETLLSGHLEEIFPNTTFERNPGIYHYMTASLLACEVYNEGFMPWVGDVMAYFSKWGYKRHKFKAQYEREKFDKKGRRQKNLLRLRKKIKKKQGYKTGVKAGDKGGDHGIRFCRAFDRDSRRAKKKLYRKKLRSNRSERRALRRAKQNIKRKKVETKK